MVNVRAASEFIATLLHGVTMAHMHHLMVTGQGAYAAHVALGELYEGLQAKTDELAECVMGCENIGLAFTGGSFTLGADPLADVNRLYEYVEANKMIVGYEPHVQNVVDEICTVIARALYKLRRLQ